MELNMTRAMAEQRMIEVAKSLFQRNYTYSTGGNISCRIENGFTVTTTGSSFGYLRPGDFSACDLLGNPMEGEPNPSKEAAFHARIYSVRPEVKAVLHLHAPGAIALSCLAQPTDSGNVLPAVTPGCITRVGRLPLLEYIAPGAPKLADRMGTICQGVNAVLMQNHGVTTFAPSLDEAVSIAEELEQSIRVWLQIGPQARLLTATEISSLTVKAGHWAQK